jgi:hypothetical protein
LEPLDLCYEERRKEIAIRRTEVELALDLHEV